MEDQVDFGRIGEIFRGAEAEGRDQLYEFETYELLEACRAESVPRARLIRRGTRLTNEDIASFPGDRVVLKVTSTAIVHKSDVGGVRVVEKQARAVRSGWRRMLDEAAERFTARLEARPAETPARFQGLSGGQLKAAVEAEIAGVLMTEYLPPDSEALGNELLVSLRRTREFGMVITAGLGGTDTELYAMRFRPGQAVVSASTAMVSGREFFDLFKTTIAYEKIAGLDRSGRRLVSDEQLLGCFSDFIAVANHFSPLNPEAPFVIDELEINPFAFCDYQMVPLDGLCRFSRPLELTPPRDLARLGSLLHPQSMAIMGVSGTKVNFGRNILRSLLQSGFPPQRLTVINPGAGSIEGVACVASLADLPAPVDLLILAVAAEQVPDLLDQIIDGGRAESVILIPGGLGETQGSQERARQVIAKIRATHARPGGGPVFLGGNCLGVVSRPGSFDTFFAPATVAPKRRDQDPAPVALICQSGAFAVIRGMKLIPGDPLYNVTVGNQMDLTIGDFVNHLVDDPAIAVMAIYAEGFQDYDGLHLSRGIRRAVEAGKEVIVYKAGRTPEGKLATSGHTASVAGDYVVCTACLTQAGALVAETFEEFDSLMNLAALFHAKEVRGNRVVGVGSAGFEAVGMADYLQKERSSLALAELAPATREAVGRVLAEAGLDRLVDIKNPLDLTPQAGDEVHARVIAAVSQDPGVDCIVASLDSMSPATGDDPAPDTVAGYTDRPDSFGRRLADLARDLAIPLLVFNDAPRLHEPVSAKVERSGIPVFPTCGQAMAALARYADYRLRLAGLRRRAAG